MNTVQESLLGKEVTYSRDYSPELLFPIPRQKDRKEIGISVPLPFKGVDIWNAFELSWLNQKGKPVVAAAEFRVPCESSHIIESKSLKLYLNSLNGAKFSSLQSVKNVIQQDLTHAAGADVQVNIHPIDQIPPFIIGKFDGINLDELDISCDCYEINPSFLKNETGTVTEVLYSDLLKSNCLVTNQPDWASVQIRYTGRKINHEGLLKYIVSFRDHRGFHEQCVEKIFADIIHYCQPEQLTVYARYTRRGGLDINPYRSTEHAQPENVRLVRQ